MKHATLALLVKRASDSERTFTGTATHSREDRLGDIVEPRGARFKLPLPLLWSHQPGSPVGWVERATIQSDGIEVECRIAKIDTPGPLKDATETAWEAVRTGLVRSLSIGFIVLKAEPINGGGIRIVEWDWAELSLVSVPAQPLATIDAVKERTERDRRSARHEAGHAIAAHVLGRGVDHVTIGPGRMVHGNGPASPRNRIVISLAGSIASHGNLNGMSTGDRKNIQHAVAALLPGSRNADALLRELTREAKGLLTKHAAAVDAVADALMQRRTLFGFEVSQLARKHRRATVRTPAPAKHVAPVRKSPPRAPAPVCRYRAGQRLVGYHLPHHPIFEATVPTNSPPGANSSWRLVGREA